MSPTLFAPLIGNLTCSLDRLEPLTGLPAGTFYRFLWHIFLAEAARGFGRAVNESVFTVKSVATGNQRSVFQPLPLRRIFYSQHSLRPRRRIVPESEKIKGNLIPNREDAVKKIAPASRNPNLRNKNKSITVLFLALHSNIAVKPPQRWKLQ
jgi:hypothetical protein